MLARSETFTWLPQNISSHKYAIINGILLLSMGDYC